MDSSMLFLFNMTAIVCNEDVAYVKGGTCDRDSCIGTGDRIDLIRWMDRLSD